MPFVGVGLPDRWCLSNPGQGLAARVVLEVSPSCSLALTIGGDHMRSAAVPCNSNLV